MGKNKSKKVWYKRWWAITLFIFIGIGILGSVFDGTDTSPPSSNLNIPRDEIFEEVNPNQEQVQEKCLPSWECDSWSECSASETQTRTCTDSNDCWTSSGKPETSQSCFFDVSEYDLEMSIKEIVNEFDGLTELQQKEKSKELKGKRIKTSIKVSEVNEAGFFSFSDYVVTQVYNPPYEYLDYARAYFPEEDKENLLDLNKGDRVIFTGEFVSYTEVDIYTTVLYTTVEFINSRFIGVE